MSKPRKIYSCDTALKVGRDGVKGELVEIENLKYYKISNYDSMPVFFMSLVGSGDHWMFISSNGALTAGRRDPVNALFPYTTDDKITDSTEYTGPKTIFLIHEKEKDFLWEPFSIRQSKVYKTQRNIYKSIYGNILRFEEINLTLGISFYYSWQFSSGYGFVKISGLTNLQDTNRNVSIIDGIQNILPYGVDESMQLKYSTLVDAYKMNELDPTSGMGIYYLSSIPTDKAEPSEGLKATAVWSSGLQSTSHLLSSEQLDEFRLGRKLEEENEIKARRGAYFVSAELVLEPHANLDWIVVAELERDRKSICELIKQLESPEQLKEKVIEDLNKGTANLIELVSKADGFQCSGDELVEARHFSNVLYNSMRGGIFPDQYTLDRSDFLDYLKSINVRIFNAHKSRIGSHFPPVISRKDLLSFASSQGDPDLWRACTEYLPLSFSRRHGDPSRPWNRFYINNQNPDGSTRIDYQGNWRDIFQNWEALAYSFPEFLSGMICRFLNASTADGYNPYRIMKSGIEWELIDPDDPWSNIGYWGDHQIIYLLKLLEASEQFYPGQLEKWFSTDYFAYANVPYRIVELEDRLKNPRSTILFDDATANAISMRVKEIGADGKLIWDDKGVYRVNLVEKLLVPVLAKLSNFIVDGGIWLNTQRPEWNDANNALVGNGLSMVTVYYLRRHLSFIRNLFKTCKKESFIHSCEVVKWMGDVKIALTRYEKYLQSEFTPATRRKLLEDLGEAFDKYLNQIYSKGFSNKKETILKTELIDFFSLMLKYIDGSISMNRREDGLYHAYNIMKIEPDGGISLSRLQEMLEGQVAVLSSGCLSNEQSIEVLKTLRKSKMYRADQNSYMLYPDRRLPLFQEKNKLGRSSFSGFYLIQECLKKNDFRILMPDGEGTYQFNGVLKNAADLIAMLDDLKEDYPEELIMKEQGGLVELFENTFGHHSFTGRSGTFFKYEGLGSIYWHMVSKLVLAIQEVYLATPKEEGVSTTANQQKLLAFYNETKEGLGLHKSPEKYGAFPIDPYSHTPAHLGVQQPGMTGQVKEDILIRWKELGLVINKGKLSFQPVLLKEDEFLSETKSFIYTSPEGKPHELTIPKKALAFTFCQVPIIYHLSDEKRLRIHLADGSVKEEFSNSLSLGFSAELFERTGRILKIEVGVRHGEPLSN